MKHKLNPFLIPFILLYVLAANGWLLITIKPILALVFVLLIISINVFAGRHPTENLGIKKNKLEYHGVESIFIFIVSCAASVIYQIILIYKCEKKLTVVISIIWCVFSLAVLFWNGIISLYVTSAQLGIKTRAVGVICGWLFPANLAVLIIILVKCRREVWFEKEKSDLNRLREKDRICATKYPILLVHGVFFRDFKLLNYWGRIPEELKRNGAVIYYGEHQSASSVKDSAVQLKARIEAIVRATGCEKVNIIAHSKGGLDSRCAVADGAGEYIASLTTINTPHRGCEFADYLLKKVPLSIQKKIEESYNSVAEKIGDESPDFMAAVTDLTADKCEEFNSAIGEMPREIYCQSYGSQLMKASGGKFPLNFSYNLVKRFDGPNDGLVGKSSCEWGEKFTFIVPPHKRGISHGDMIDLNRENIPGFDVREFYVQLVSDLRKRGL